MILDNIDLKLMEKPDESTLGGERNAVFFTREQLTAELRFLVPVSHPDSRSDPIGGSELSLGCENIY